ncbi:MAG TPA: histidinol-phosphate transaminase [Gemmatimonas sp.]|nr:histidinol-phosphate transaminase [Gemmatimonas sp.]
MSDSISRRQWLIKTGLGVGATVALPGLLPAMESARVMGGVGYGEVLRQLEHDITLHRRAAGPIRLCFNENPFGMSPKAKDALMGAWSEHPHYASPALAELTSTFAATVGVKPEQVLVTQGSSEVLSLVALAYGMRGGEIVLPWPTFEQLPEYATSMGMTVHKVPLTSELGHDFQAMEAKVGGETKLVFVCNPNNPTAVLDNQQRMRDFVTSTAKRCVVVVDEAYHDFVDDPNYRSMTDLVTAGHNIIVSRTASKIHSLAGLRIGFAVAHPDVIKRLAEFSTGAPNTFGARAAIASLKDTEYQDFVKAKNREGRKLLVDALVKAGKRVAPSHTNFVFFHAGRPVAGLQKHFLDRGFMVGRTFQPFTDWCRVSIGTPEEMKQFVTLIPGALA